jgi:hypothetical protein
MEERDLGSKQTNHRPPQHPSASTEQYDLGTSDLMTLCKEKDNSSNRNNAISRVTAASTVPCWPWKEGEEKDEIMRADFQV